MKLIERFAIDIPEEKIAGYALSPTHKLGSHKAAYFRSYGFTLENISEFLEAIKKLIATYEITSEIKKEHGINYIVEGAITSPTGKTLSIRTIWNVKELSLVARLVTVYPK